MLDEAIEQAKSHCRLLEETNYHSVSLRGILYKLGYTEVEADVVIEDCARRGFNYCIDPMVPFKEGHRSASNLERPPEFACYWGPDQLRSRLECLNSRDIKE